MPAVSIILPTFNRERFIPDALASIEQQTFTDWELIVVDDGSTDQTRAVVERYQGSRRPPRYVHQANRGAYAARNRGLDLATGKYIAFFDSDDLWLPGYLARCVDALDAHSDLDWVYLACRSVDEATGETLSESTFYVDGAARPFLATPGREVSPGLKVLSPPHALTSHLEGGLYAGLQNSVIRRRVFDEHRFWEDYRVVEDALFLLRALCRGLQIGFIDEVQVIYRVHAGNSSAAGTAPDAERLIPIYEEEIRGLERVRVQTGMANATHALLERQLGSKYFWRLGYGGYWQAGRREEALRALRAGMALGGANWAMWKTYALCRLRTLVGA